jgi:hypothetical protein
MYKDDLSCTPLTFFFFSSEEIKYSKPLDYLFYTSVDRGPSPYAAVLIIAIFVLISLYFPCRAVAGWLGGWMAGWLNGCMSVGLGAWMAGWLEGWMAGWLEGWVAGWLDCWMAGWL